MARDQKAKSQSLIPVSIRTTRDLRMSLLQTYDDLLAKKITPGEARARAQMARAILDTVRTELTLARNNTLSYHTIDLTAQQELNVKDGDLN